MNTKNQFLPSSQTQKQIKNPQTNRTRLLEQNQRLYRQIHRLQTIFNKLFIKQPINQQQQPLKISILKQQALQQQMLIKKYKKKILLIKNQHKPQQNQHLRIAIDQLKYIKLQRQKYMIQKQTITKNTKLKSSTLQLHKPLQQSKTSLIHKFKQYQHENNQIKNQILKMEKEINNLHQTKQLHKILSNNKLQLQRSQKSQKYINKIPQNPVFEISKIQNQITKTRNQLLFIQKQWQPRIQSLNSEYFLLKDIQNQKQQKDKQINKIINTYKNRILCMKQQSKIIQQKQRLSHVIISEEKRNQIQEKIQSEIDKNQWLQDIKKRPTNQNKNRLINTQNHKNNSNNKNNNNINNNYKKKLQIKQKHIKSPQSQPQKEILQLQISKNSRYSQRLQNNKEFNSHNIDKQKYNSTFSAKNQLIMKQIKLQTKQTKDFYIQAKQIEQTLKKGIQKQKQKPKKTFLSVAIGTTFYYNQNQDEDQGEIIK